MPILALDDTVAGMQRRFALQLHRAACDEAPDRNVFLSPLSVWLLLAAVWTGARGGTETALAEALCLGRGDRDRVSNMVRYFLADLNMLERGASTRIANALLARADISFRENFIAGCRRTFRSDVFSGAFDDPALLEEVNAWVRKNTYGMIDRLLNGLGPGLILTLINAVAFRAAWTTAFDNAQTTDGASFTLADGSTVEVSMMRRSGEFAYFETSTFQACALPYGENGCYSMYVVLPKGGSNLRPLHDELAPAVWDRLVALRDPNRTGTVCLPRFRVKATTELRPYLCRLGLDVIFSPEHADFSGMADLREPLYINRVVQQVFVDVDEKGTEAAALTELDMLSGIRQLDSAPPFMMNVNRPFFCAIGSLSGAAMFVGAIYNPVEAICGG